MKPGAPDSLGAAEREQRACERHDLEPRPGDEAAAACVDDDCGREPARERSEHDAVPDLLCDEPRGVAVPDRALLGLGDRERDEEQGDADAVVESALDVEALADPDGQASGGARRPDRARRRWARG